MPVKLQGGGDDHEDDARIEVVPLIDIMFFLLASFMMVSLSMTQIHRVNLKLPSSTSSVADNKTPPIHLAIDSHGVITWDAEIVTPSEITQRLLALPPTEDTKVLIGGDEDSDLKHSIAVIDAARAAGVEKVSFETKHKEP
ncbi:biopolymer transporter ExbD [Luteolibacter flavescens]|uniref:Biopolymer transporter ExbD n=1 Tax=Luteolibacter flavescens TaxID=1859460 RepID=A0ABT3FTH2_9BACT|nr:biopolymer transporter ExbD [Luteolibacter flavescens]MCW1886519.1 biopolymer transporter ExbD [Luteolibacter flavescens]